MLWLPAVYRLDSTFIFDQIAFLCVFYQHTHTHTHTLAGLVLVVCYIVFISSAFGQQQHTLAAPKAV